MPTSEEEANALLASSGPSFVGSTIAVPDSSVALEDGYQSQKVSDEEQRKSRKALARRWSEPYSDDGSVDLLDPTRFGLLVNYACIGFLNGLLPALVYPFFKLYLNMDGFQVSAAATVKQQAQDLKRLGGSSRFAARVAIIGIVATLTWATTTNILAIHSSTACLIIAGGQGC
ncbi:hypothetical protein KRP22_010127 [Phytophthora ramorum]|nr:hypothetical protein KRP22_6003 [Phytophthora ramorum]